MRTITLAFALLCAAHGVGWAAPSGCFTDTTQAQWNATTLTNIDTKAVVDSAVLTSTIIDARNEAMGNIASGMSTSRWAQTFTPTVSGTFVAVEIYTDGFCSTAQNLTAELRTTSGGTPTATVLASSVLPGWSSGGFAWRTTNTFPTVSVTAGTTYAIVLQAPSGCFYGMPYTSNTYAGGRQFINSYSTLWEGNSDPDWGFRVSINPGYRWFGTVESTKDSNPGAGIPAWGTFSYTASVPSNTVLWFQLSASNNTSNFPPYVGQDGTEDSWFPNGASLARFNGYRYLRYRARLETMKADVTPTLADVTVCYLAKAPTSLTLGPSATITYGEPATLRATLNVNHLLIADATIAFFVDGSPVGTALTDASGVATLANVALHAGAHAITASFAADATKEASNAAGSSVTVTQASQVIAFDVLPDRPRSAQPFALVATGGASGNPIHFSTTSPACHIEDGMLTVVDVGVCDVHANQAGNADYLPAPEATQSFTIARTAQVVSFAPLTRFPVLSGSTMLEASSTSSLPVSLQVVSGACAIDGHILTATAVGVCEIQGTQAGDTFFAPAAAVTRSVDVDPEPQTLAVDAPAPFVWKSGASVSALASSGLDVTFVVVSGPCTIEGTELSAQGGGACEISAQQGGDALYAFAETTFLVTLLPAPQMLAPEPIAAIGAGASAQLPPTTAAGLPLNYAVESGPCTIVGATLTSTGSGTCTIRSRNQATPTTNPPRHV